MDIAKIRKKFRDTGQTCEGPSLLPVLPPVSVEDIEKKTDIPSSTLPDKAEEYEKGDSPDSLLELLTFHLSLEEYAFRIEEIQEIIRSIKITRVPRSANYLIGITSLSSVVEAPLHISESEKKFIEGIVTADHRFISLLRTGEVMNITLKEAM
jgi:chemotaxis signal transduction protein